ncbi:RNA-binding protein [Candidatus Micrarchaeota archaeon CG_4_10_14_0_2_um_filter_60_11]|nr:MAG: RNA-binding protein [Candidatus Micrarchaeota archaeon CG10_big_fil_rev_8_21_14_0_10_60_32]PIO01773.1 MAG: RNA-binding protein [Candidatus Micrarchaeota archaeon CG09_land_8_20_14_0_10_60_16]PIY91486.1 MAG: RNA-binding protein [Candidatus Micrarchaeota archaeon CG_4_10_14_0_8_um_filter_60_7]PIZ91168.1 MAG: RNA-binding protein [Candidatus Micrarchaeota archaeon CG_4_10_14_0_2_um_filter_60_11]
MACISCGRASPKHAKFPCPECGAPVERCADCRKNENKYKCQKCGFQGP